MKYQVIVLPEAQSDADRIYAWIAKRSSEGAGRWYTKFLATLHELETNAEGYGLAPESDRLARPIRQVTFKTSKGLRYRILYSVDVNTVVILHVRGPGQDAVQRT